MLDLMILPESNEQPYPAECNEVLQHDHARIGCCCCLGCNDFRDHRFAWWLTYVSPATGPSSSGDWFGGGAGFGGGVWSTWAIDNGQLQFDSSDFLGVITKAEMGAVVLSAAPNWGGALTIDFAGTAMSSSSPPATYRSFSYHFTGSEYAGFYVTNFPHPP